MTQDQEIEEKNTENETNIDACNDSDFVFDFNGPVVEDLQGFKDDLALFQMELDEQRPDQPNNLLENDELQEFLMPLNLDQNMGLRCVADLDAEGIVFFEYYRTTYCNFVSIGLKSLNYFNKTFIGLANVCTGVAYAVTAWGGFYLELQKPRCDFTRPWTYMQKAAKAMCDEMGSELKPSSKEQLLSLFGFYLIFIGIEVCTGDIRNWRGLMNQCKDLIHSYGGPISLSHAFEDSNDIKWLLSNFCFHDILSSHTLTVGTTFPMSEYETVVSPNLSYGIDPLHGIVSPVYLIFGHIGNSKARLASLWEVVTEKVANNDPQGDILREQYYEEVERVTAEIKGKIDTCHPSDTHLELLGNDPKAREIHTALFQLYIFASRIQLGTSIQKLPQCALSQQHLLLQSFKLLDMLLVTPVKVALSLLILVCGVLCCNERDRLRMTTMFRMHLKQYEIGNLQRIEETVLEAWQLSPEGNTCLDWADLVRDKSWHLYVG